MSLFDLFPAEVVDVAAGVCVGLFGRLGGVMGPVILGDSYDYTWSFLWGFARIGIGAAGFSCAHSYEEKAGMARTGGVHHSAPLFCKSYDVHSSDTSSVSMYAVPSFTLPSTMRMTQQ